MLLKWLEFKHLQSDLSVMSLMLRDFGVREDHVKKFDHFLCLGCLVHLASMLGAGNVNIDHVLPLICQLILDVGPEILVGDGHIILEALPVEFHPLLLYLQVAIGHVCRGNQVPVMLHQAITIRQGLLSVLLIVKLGIMLTYLLRLESSPGFIQIIKRLNG